MPISTEAYIIPFIMVSLGKERIIRITAILLNGIALAVLTWLCWVMSDVMSESDSTSLVVASIFAVSVMIPSQIFSLLAFSGSTGDGRVSINIKKNIAILLNLLVLCGLIILVGKILAFFGDCSINALLAFAVASVFPIFSLLALYRVAGDTWITKETIGKPIVIVSAGIAVLLMYFAALAAVETPAGYSSRASSRFGEGDYKRAIEDYSKVIELAPKEWLAYMNRGFAYGTLDDYRQEIEDYSRVIELKPKYTLAYRYRGDVYDKLGDSKRAIEDYDKVIELDPKYADTYNKRGLAYGKLGDSKRAIEDHNKAIALETERHANPPRPARRLPP